jgi:hypothetical protein
MWDVKGACGSYGALFFMAGMAFYASTSALLQTLISEVQFFSVFGLVFLDNAQAWSRSKNGFWVDS